MTPSADTLDRMTDREARAVWAAEAVSLRARLNDALAEVRRLQSDNERMRRGLEAVRDWNYRDRHGVALSRGLDNLLAGREWSESGVE